MQHCHYYHDFKILWCLRSDCWRWHIWLEVPGSEDIHIGPDDLESFSDAKRHIDAQEQEMFKAIAADIALFGEYVTVEP